MPEDQAPPRTTIKKRGVRHHAKRVFHIAVYFFAAAGFILIVGYFAVLLRLTNVSGATDLNDRYFAALHSQDNSTATLENASGTASFGELALWCKLFALKNDSPADAAHILTAYQKTNSPSLALSMIESVNERAVMGTPLQNDFAACDAEWLNVTVSSSSETTSVYPWMGTPEWGTLSQAIKKDAPVINSVSTETGVPPRMIAHGGAAIAAEYASRRFAVRDAFRNELTIYETDGTQTLVPQLFRGTGVAISP